MNTTQTHGATPGQAAPENSEYHAAVVAFAKKGHMLQRHFRAGDGRVAYTVSRWSSSRSFSDWHSLQGFLAQVGGQV